MLKGLSPPLEMDLEQYTATIINGLYNAIDDANNKRMLFVYHPGCDFTRKRLFNFPTIIMATLLMGPESLQSSLDKIFDNVECGNAKVLDLKKQAFNEQYGKIMSTAGEYIFHRLVEDIEIHSPKRTYNGYRFIAVDSSVFNIPHNKEDIATLCDGDVNQISLHGLYDVIQEIYVDLYIAPKKKLNLSQQVNPETGEALPSEGKSEREVAIIMIKRTMGLLGEKIAFLGDRGYGGWNTVVTMMEIGATFCFRVLDYTKQQSMVYRFRDILDEKAKENDGEFDIIISTIFTNMSAYKKNPDYTYLTGDYYFLDEETRFYEIKNLRICRLKLSTGEYEVLVTNLPQDIFPFEDMKKIYYSRWNVITIS